MEPNHSPLMDILKSALPRPGEQPASGNEGALTMPQPAVKLDRFTDGDYRHWPDDERWKLIDGEVYDGNTGWLTPPTEP